LKLRGEIAKREADVSQQQANPHAERCLPKSKRLFPVGVSLTNARDSQSDGELLKQIEQAADARYRSGMGRQQDLLQAQLQKTKLVRELPCTSGSWQAASSVEAVSHRARFAGHRAGDLKNLLSCRTSGSFSGLPRRKTRNWLHRKK